MRFKTKRKLTRQERRNLARDYYTNWHTVFAWTPKRTSDTEIVWLESIERRYPFIDPIHYVPVGKPDYRVLDGTS